MKNSNQISVVMGQSSEISNQLFPKSCNRIPNSEFRKLSSGFTLVELLVVIGVIALVMAVLFPNFMGFRQRARDAQRKSDLAQIQKALELYKQDQILPAYPTTGAFGPSLCGQCWSSGGSCSENVYMRKLPCDPVGGTTPTPYIYQLGSDTLQFTISACLENAGDPDRDNPTASGCTSSTNASYTINEP